MIKSILKKYYWLLGIYLLVLLLYFPVFFNFFSQDDFFHFKISETDGSLVSFVKLIGFPKFEDRGYAFYRPLTREGLYNLYYSLFRLNVLPFHLLSFGIHFINIYLVFALVKRIFLETRIAKLAAFLFGISAIQVGVFFYSAGGIEVSVVTLFILLTILFFDYYLETKIEKYKYLSLASLLFTLSSHEIGAMTPVLLSGLILAKKFKFNKYLVKFIFVKLWPFYLTLILYLYLDIVHIGFHQQELQYKPIFSLKTLINTFAWYVTWAFGIPEMLVDFVGPGLRLNPSLMRYWGDYFKIIFPSFGISITSLLALVIYFYKTKKKLYNNKPLWFFIFWFPLFLFPVLLLPQHKFVYYLTPALPAFCAVFSFFIIKGIGINKRLIKIISLSLLFSLTLISVTASFLGKDNYWAATRGKIAQKLIQDIKQKYPNIPANSVIYIENDPNYPYVAKDWGGTSKQAKYILNDQDAVQLIYKDKTLKTFYEDDAVELTDFAEENVYRVVAILH